MMSLYERAEALRQAVSEEDRLEAAYMLAAQTAMGLGVVEEQVIRLMVWVATCLPHGERHTLLEHPVEILESRTAWCDQNARVLIWCCKNLLDLPGRILELKHTDGVNGHTVCEIFYLDAWRLFDADSRHTACYRSFEPAAHVEGYDVLCKEPGIVISLGHWWRGADGRGMEGFFVHPATIYEGWPERKLRHE